MSIFTNYRKHDKEFRAQHDEVIKAGLDCLKDTDGSDEIRGELVDHLKDSLDSHAEWEEAVDRYEYSTGRLHGYLLCLGTVIGGYTIGSVIEYFVNKKG